MEQVDTSVLIASANRSGTIKLREIILLEESQILFRIIYYYSYPKLPN